MSDFYTDAQRDLQRRHDSERLADRLEQAIVSDVVDLDQHGAFIAGRDFFFLSTVNGRGEPTVSYKGGDPGVLAVLDEHTLAFPDYDGNGMFLSLGNIAETAKVGLLLIDLETPHRLRVQGTASVVADDPLVARWPGARSVVRVRVDDVFVNCARYVHRHARTDRSPYVPDTDGGAPYPSWKRLDVFADVLPGPDQGRTETEGGPIDLPEYAARLAAGDS